MWIKSSYTFLLLLVCLQSNPGMGQICEPLDLAFLIDSSNSVGLENYNIVKDFVAQVISTTTINTYISLTTWSSEVVSNLYFNDAINQRGDRQAVLNRLSALPNLAENTYTWFGLRQLRSVFTPFLGDRPGILNAGIVITDGTSQDISATLEAADQLHADGVWIIAVGIGSAINLTEIRGIASPGGQLNRDYFLTPNFNTVSQIVIALSEMLCDLQASTTTVVPICSVVECLNGGTCVDLPGDFFCVCPNNREGRFCEMQTSPCFAGACSNGGTCVENVSLGTFTCLCATPYTGPLCETLMSPCVVGACSNGGTCVENVPLGTFTCVCLPPFVGPSCETRIDFCTGDPCINGGSCAERLTGFICNCPPTHTGPYCEIAIRQCLSQPCFNGATCVDYNGGYDCLCDTGFTGTNCETPIISVCDSDPCYNDGSCILLSQGGYRCVCQPFYTGPQCEISSSPCTQIECRNGGECVDRNGDFQCQCEAGYYGSYCENRRVCGFGQFLCQNGGWCVDTVDTDSGFYCRCPQDYTGTYCQTKIDDVVEGEEEPKGLSIQYIVLIAVGVALFIILVAIMIWYCMRRDQEIKADRLQLDRSTVYEVSVLGGATGGTSNNIQYSSPSVQYGAPVIHYNTPATRWNTSYPNTSCTSIYA